MNEVFRFNRYPREIAHKRAGMRSCPANASEGARSVTKGYAALSRTDSANIVRRFSPVRTKLEISHRGLFQAVWIGVGSRL